MSNEQAETSRDDMNTPKPPALACRLFRNTLISAQASTAVSFLTSCEIFQVSNSQERASSKRFYVFGKPKRQADNCIPPLLTHNRVSANGLHHKINNLFSNQQKEIAHNYHRNTLVGSGGDKKIKEGHNRPLDAFVERIVLSIDGDFYGESVPKIEVNPLTI